MGPFSPLSASTFVQPFFPDPPFCQAQDGPQAKPKSNTCVQDFLYFSESHSLVVVWWDRKKPGIVATKTRCLVPPTLKSPIDEGLPYRHRGMCSQKQKTKKVILPHTWCHPDPRQNYLLISGSRELQCSINSFYRDIETKPLLSG